MNEFKTFDKFLNGGLGTLVDKIFHGCHEIRTEFRGDIRFEEHLKSAREIVSLRSMFLADCEQLEAEFVV